MPPRGGASRPAPPATRAPPRRAELRRAPSAGRCSTRSCPGPAFLATGRRVLGAVVLAAVPAPRRRRRLARHRRSALRGPRRRRHLVAALVVVGVAVVHGCSGSPSIVAGYLLLVPRGTARGRRALGGLVVLLLLAAVVVPAVFAGRLALDAARPHRRGLPRRRRSRRRSTTTPTRSATRSGSTCCCSAATAARGARASAPTPSSSPASTPTPATRRCSACPATSRTCPSPRTARWPSSTRTASTPARESESLLNAVYRNGPAMHPDVLGPTDNPGADFLKLGVGEALGLDLDYYVLINLEGFSRLVDALGGITVNVNYWVPIGGEPTRAHPARRLHRPRARTSTWTASPRWSSPAAGSASPTTTGWPGSAARSTRSSTPPTRSRCCASTRSSPAPPRTSSSPTSPARRWTTSSTWRSWSRTPTIRSVVFDNSVIGPAYPDYDLIRRHRHAGARPPTGTDGRDDRPRRAHRRRGPGDDRRRRRPPTDARSATPGAERRGRPAGPPSDVRDACAYDREAAEAGPRSRASRRRRRLTGRSAADSRLTSRRSGAGCRRCRRAPRW